MSIQLRVSAFVNYLASIEVDKHSCENIYSTDDYDAQLRRENLNVYLNQMIDLAPRLLLIGEAPGYAGCRLTGVPFTSEKIISTNPFFKTQGYKTINDKNKLCAEQSATIVWNELNRHRIKPLIWNIFPFHPYKPGDVLTNRAPNAKEVELGFHILQELQQLFQIEKIGAVGRKAAQMLEKNNIPCQYIRHPANGGKREFVKGLKEFISE